MKFVNKQILIILLVLLIVASQSAASQVAIVVSDSNSVDNLTLTELRRIFQGKKTTFDNYNEIQIIDYAPLKEIFYEKVLGMSILKVKKYWMKIIFSGEYVNPPRELKNLDDIRSFFCKNQDGISFINSEDVTDCMKIVKINGKLPGEEGYPLEFEDELE